MDGAIKVLLIEGNIRDACEVCEALDGVRGVRFEYERCDDLAQGIDRLGAEKFDVILVDLALPDSNGLATLAAVRDAAGSVPFIVLSAFRDRSLARRVVQEGAQDYLVIGQICSDSLGRSINYAIERKAVEGELVEAVHEAEEADRAKSDFLSNVSHEIRTPLTSMCNILSNFAAGVGGQLKGKHREYVSMLDEDCTRLRTLVEKLLNLSRLQAGKMPIDRGPTDVAAVAGEAVRGVRHEAELKCVAVDVEVVGPLSCIDADGSLLLQVFTNLVYNAIKFTPEGGSITVRLRDRGAEIHAAVADSGIGISAENLEKVFDKFAQVNRKKGGKGAQGTGIGLAICQEIVDLHEGKIWVESNPGQGSTFQFTLPRSQPAGETEKPVEAGAQQELLEVK